MKRPEKNIEGYYIDKGNILIKALPDQIKKDGSDPEVLTAGDNPDTVIAGAGEFIKRFIV